MGPRIWQPPLRARRLRVRKRHYLTQRSYERLRNRSRELAHSHRAEKESILGAKDFDLGGKLQIIVIWRDLIRLVQQQYHRAGPSCVNDGWIERLMLN